ncbi:hypothetical protein [Planococcus versutus]|uniref:hypothetical protein n=1 Tax=Planococcus versutus TaxID=1302659 RepID=UPI001EF56B37|nr:hypothetical protein [Planococcus versutus]
MKKRLLLIPSLLVFTLVACSQQVENTAATDSATLLSSDWQKIAESAKGSEVNVYMWGGNDNINRYLDEWVAPRLKKEHDLELNRVPMNDSQDIVNQLVDEKAAGKTSGSMDIIWINGENFKVAKDNELLWGSFTNKLPNFVDFIDQDAPEIANDFGEPVDGLEAPWGKPNLCLFTIKTSQKILRNRWKNWLSG